MKDTISSIQYRYNGVDRSFDIFFYKRNRRGNFCKLGRERNTFQPRIISESANIKFSQRKTLFEKQAHLFMRSRIKEIYISRDPWIQWGGYFALAPSCDILIKLEHIFENEKGKDRKLAPCVCSFEEISLLNWPIFIIQSPIHSQFHES